MRITPDRKNEIIRIFQASFKRDNSDELKGIELKELIEADEMIGNLDLNAGWRIAIRNRIQALIKEQDKKSSSKQRWLDRLIGAAIAIVVFIVARLIWSWIGQ